MGDLWFYDERRLSVVLKVIVLAAWTTLVITTLTITTWTTVATWTTLWLYIPLWLVKQYTA